MVAAQALIVNQAARNNALWCDTVCATHNGAGEFCDDLWLNRFGAPRFYPDVVTLAGAEAAAAQTQAIAALCKAAPLRAWAAKDSFHSLDLAPLGFAPLFDAQWICAPAGAGGGRPWRRVDDEAGLLDWEQAWSNEPVLAEARLFRAGLLASPDVRFLFVLDQGALAGGGILNRGAGVVGISNVFVASGDLGAIWAGLVDAARSTFPRLPVVAYEHDEATLAAACGAGFSAVGTLKVWLRAARGAP